MRPPDSTKIFNVALHRKSLPTPALDTDLWRLYTYVGSANCGQ